MSLFRACSTIQRKEGQNGWGLFSGMLGGAISREGSGEAGATFHLKQHFGENELESAPCSTLAAQQGPGSSHCLTLSRAIHLPSVAALNPPTAPHTPVPRSPQDPPPLVFSRQWCLLLSVSPVSLACLLPCIPSGRLSWGRAGLPALAGACLGCRVPLLSPSFPPSP